MKKLPLILGAFLIIASCSEPQSPRKMEGMFTYGIITLDTPVSYALLGSCSKGLGFVFDSTSKYILVWPHVSSASAYFGDVADTSKWQPAGTVTLNGSALPDSAGNTYQYLDAPVYLDGRTQVWNVQGSSTVPAIKDSLLGPYDSVTIASPPNAANISESSGLTVTWNSGNTAETGMIIIIPSAGGQGYSDEISGSTSSYTIPSASLSEIPKGRATISISRGVYKIGKASNGQSYIMVVWSNDTRDINLQ